MLTHVHPKLPMRDRRVTSDYYARLGFQHCGDDVHAEYLMMKKDSVELHFFLFVALDPFTNDGQVYIRTDDIDGLYKDFVDDGVVIHPNGPLEMKPWGQREFSVLDPDMNLLTFGQGSD